MADPSPEPSAWSIFWSRLREQPVFCTLLLALVAGSPWAIAWLQRQREQSGHAHALGEWLHALEGAGLPAPFLTPEDVRPPAGCDRPDDGAPPEATDLYALLECWQALRADRPVSEVPATVTPASREMRSALVACRWLRVAAEGDPAALGRARDAIGVAPTVWRPTLDLAADLIAGQTGAVLTRATGMARGAVPRACKAVVGALVREAAGRRTDELLAERPASLTSLDELIALCAAHEEVAARVRAAGDRVAELVTPGSGDVARAQRVLTLLAAVQPDGPATAAGWPAVREALATVTATHLGNPDSEEYSALTLVGDVAAVDSRADLPGPAAYAQWRAQLGRVLDRPDALVDYALRSLETGRLPVGVEEVIASHAAMRDAQVPAELTTAGAELTRLELTCLRTPLEPAEVARLANRVEARLGSRSDPGAGRIRARAAFLLGRALLEEDPAVAAASLAQAEALGFEPRPQLLAAQARILPRPEAAKRLAERARLLEEHAARLAGAGPDRLLAWELSGYPTAQRVIDRQRAEARLDLAEQLVADDPKGALQEARLALKLTPQAARGHLVVALAHQAAGRASSARAAVERGLRAVTPAEPKVAERLRLLEQELSKP